MAVGGVVIDANFLQMHHVDWNLADSMRAVNENTLDTIALADLSIRTQLCVGVTAKSTT